MLHNNYIFIGLKQRTDDLCSFQPLFHIKIAGWLIEHINICFFHSTSSYCKSLELTTR
uniref:Uncharacterized protein n=1 Tax=Arundo donax TaxID=35708 RepID=A0A0A9AQ77_ARUDO